MHLNVVALAKGHGCAWPQCCACVLVKIGPARTNSGTRLCVIKYAFLRSLTAPRIFRAKIHVKLVLYSVTGTVLHLQCHLQTKCHRYSAASTGHSYSVTGTGHRYNATGAVSQVGLQFYRYSVAGTMLQAQCHSSAAGTVPQVKCHRYSYTGTVSQEQVTGTVPQVQCYRFSKTDTVLQIQVKGTVLQVQSYKYSLTSTVSQTQVTGTCHRYDGTCTA